MIPVLNRVRPTFPRNDTPPVRPAALLGGEMDTAWCVQKFEEINRELEQITVCTEKEFLDLGGKLQDFSIRSKQIASLYLVATGLFSGVKMTDCVDSLNEMLDRVNRYLGYCNDELERNTVILKDVLHISGAIDKPLEGFRRIVKKLIMLGISTRIENSVLGQAGQFINVAEDVNRLSDMIESKAKNILQRSQELSHTIQERLREIFKLQEVHYRNANQILGQMTACLETLAGKNVLSAVAANDIKTQSESVSQRIGEMVSALQFHDITRQRIEHVQKAVKDLIQSLETPTAAGSTCEPAHTSGTITAMHGVLDLQAVHLVETQSEALGAVENILVQLEGIATHIDGMSRQTRNLVSDTNANNLSFLNQIDQGIRQVVLSLGENSRSNLRISEAIRSVMNMVEEMGRFVKDIDAIGSEIELVAMNGQIGASHLGNEGAALAVIADSIQKVSQEARRQIRDVSKSVRSVVESGQRLSVNVDPDNAQLVEGMIHEMTRDLEILLESFRGVVSEVADRFEEVNQLAEPFAREIMDTRKDVTLHTTFGTGLNKVIETLRILNGHVLDSLPGEWHSHDLSGVNLLKSRYTMASERHVHRTYLKANGVAVSDNEAIPSDSLGSNVELF